MNDKSKRILNKYIMKQIHSRSDKYSTQVILTGFNDDVIMIEPVVKINNPIRIGSDWELFLDSYSINGSVLNYDDEKEVVYLKATSEAKISSRRNYVRTTTKNKSLCRFVESGNDHYELRIFKNDEDINKIPVHIKEKFFNVYVVDISGGGLAMSTDIKIPMGQMFNVIFEDIGEFTANVVYTQRMKKGDTTIYRYGLEYANILENQRDKIIQYVFEKLRNSRKYSG